MAIIMFKRGPKGSMPELRVGEPGWCKDTHELFIGSNDGNILVSNDIETLSQLQQAIIALQSHVSTHGTVNGANIYIQPISPASPGVGDLWYDISDIGE